MTKKSDKKPATKQKREKLPPHRPTKYKPEYDEMGYKFCLLGADDEELAKMFDVTLSTINLWKLKHPSFSESLNKGKHIADAEVSQKLYNRATGYTCDDVHVSNYQGVITETPIKKHYPPDPTSMIFWLKNRQRRKWRDGHDLTTNGNDMVVYLPENELLKKSNTPIDEN